MPDKNGILADDEIERFEKCMKHHGAFARPCPVCLKTNWSMTSELMAMPQITLNRKREMIPVVPSRAVSALALQCGGCGHLALFNARTVGIV